MKICGSLAGTILPIYVAFCISCSSNRSAGSTDNDCLYQFSTIQSLAAGNFYGTVSVADFVKYGTLGLGTFVGANGEMIVLDGVCYQALGNGQVQKASLSDSVPFGAVTYFDNDYSYSFDNITFVEIQDSLTGIIKDKGANSFYACRIDGEFQYMKVRSVLKQEPPYCTLAEAVKTSQREYEYSNVKGTVVALYCPEYAGNVNAAGWHMHFISDDRTKGGHIMDFVMSEGQVQIDRTNMFMMTLPETESFNRLNLSGLDDDIDKIEKGKK